MERDYIRQGDCLELMNELPDESIDMILCDLPYGITACAWDKELPLDRLWEQYRRLIKEHGAIVLFAKEPFTSRLIQSNEKGYKHKWIWNKKISGSFYLAKYMPLQITEDIAVFTKTGERVNYYPQMRKGQMRKRGNAAKLPATTGKGFVLGYTAISDEYYPTNILEYKSERKGRLHPTEKPIALLEYLIRTYTNTGETVLDNCMGSGSTAVACIRSGRHYIGYELDEGYYKVAERRTTKEKLTEIYTTDKKYSIIYADSPWQYFTYSEKGKGRSAESHYPTMPKNEIQGLPVRRISAKTACCFYGLLHPV